MNMGRSSVRIGLAVLSFVIICWPARAEQTVELLRNPGFEGKIIQPKKDLRRGRYNWAKGNWPEGWTLQAAFNCRMEVVSGEAERRSGQAIRLDQLDGHYARIYTLEQIRVRDGVEYTFRFWARGKGEATCFMYQYSRSGAHLGGACGFRRDEKKTLSDEWQQFVHTYTPSDEDVGRIVVGIELIGRDSVGCFDDVSFTVDTDKYPMPRSALKATARLTGKGVKLYVNGNMVQVEAGGECSFELIRGENVLAVSAAGPVEATIRLEDGTALPLDANWKTSSKETAGWNKAGFDDSAWVIAAPVNRKVSPRAGQRLFLRRALFWSEQDEDGWLMGNPREFFFPRGGTEYMIAVLRSPTSSPVKDYRVVMEVPEFLRLIPLEKPAGAPWATRHLAPTAVKESSTKVGGVAYRRYELSFEPKKVSPVDVKVGKGWKLEPDLKKRAPLAPLIFVMDGEPDRDEYPVMLCRKVNGCAGELPLTVTLRIMRAFSGSRPTRIALWQALRVSYPARFEFPGQRIAYSYPDEVNETQFAQFLKSGRNYVFMGGMGEWHRSSFEDPTQPYRKPGIAEFMRVCADAGVHVGYGWNLGMNYEFRAGSRKMEEFHGWHRILLDHPEVQGKFYTGSEAKIGPEWKHAVYHRWFNTKMLFDRQYREKQKPTFWCQQYLAEGGPLYLNYWREHFKAVKEVVPEFDHALWDFELPLVGWSCFCERCIEAFRNFAKITPDVNLDEEVIAEKYPKEWIDFRFWQTAEHIGHFRKILNEHGMKLWVYGNTASQRSLEGVDWSLLRGKVDVAFPGLPGTNPGRRFEYMLEEEEAFRKHLGPDVPVVGQLIIYAAPSLQDDRHYPRKRKCELLRVVAALRGGVNEYVNIHCLTEINGVDCFARAAIDVMIKYEDWIVDGERATSAFEVYGLKSKDIAAFALPGKKTLLLVWNESVNAKDVVVTWKEGSADTAFLDGETGHRYPGGKVLNLKMKPHTVSVIECSK